MQGLGNDIIEVERIKKILDRNGERFLKRIYTTNEQDYCLARKEPSIHLAGRFAAKEAVVKALGTGFIEGITWLDIEIINDEKGRPIVHLSDKINLAFHHPIIHISISHCHNYATAIAIWE